LKPLRFESHRPRADHITATTAEFPGVTDFFAVRGNEVHEIGVGPVHAGIIEPGHFRFQCHGERVLHLEIALGYQHRGVERALVGGPNKRTIHYMETLAGDTSVGHATAYCVAVEALAGKSISSRAQQLRGIALELERLAAQALDETARRLFGRSLKLRQVSAGGCNGCEADVNVLNTVVFDLGRFGIQFVASPRHADGLLITGPITENMVVALRKTYDAVPPPKLVIAVGACAIAGGPYIDHPEVRNGAGSSLSVDLYVPGCPPHPLTILDGLLRLLGRLGGAARGSPARPDPP
jgi:Ni,Fe-hydrogenase III small subunit